MGGEINVYVDIASLYSYVAFTELMRDKEKIEAHGIKIEIHPVFLGAINAGSGNKPPWTLTAKADYLQYDTRRSLLRAGKSGVKSPEDLMAVGKTVLPLRAIWYVKQRYPEHAYHTALHYLYHCFWTPPNRNLTDEAVLRECLAETPAGSPTELGSPVEKLFGDDEVERILEAAKGDEAKEAVKNTTQEALDKGAFGAPWFWVTNDQGKSEPFFGSDRFGHIYRFLGMPFRDVEVLPPPGSGANATKL